MPLHIFSLEILRLNRSFESLRFGMGCGVSRALLASLKISQVLRQEGSCFKKKILYGIIVVHSVSIFYGITWANVMCVSIVQCSFTSFHVFLVTGSN